jgi:hypothetical protein
MFIRRKNMRSATLTFTLVIIISALLASCISTGPKVQWSKNLAIEATSRDPNSRYHDDNLYTEGETGPIIEDEKDKASQMESDKNSEAVLEWLRPQTIQRVVIKADIGEVEFFDIQYLDDQDEWQTLRKVKNHIREKYETKFKEPIVTRKLRLLVPRAWNSRRVKGGKRATRSETGAPVLTYRKIREIEAYHALPPEEPVAPVASE